VLNSNTVYGTIIFANLIPDTTFIKCLYKVNVKTFSWRLKPDSCQKQKHNTYRLNPDSRQIQNLPYLTIGSTIALFSFLAARVATVRN
jgi:hypothetical protein